MRPETHSEWHTLYRSVRSNTLGDVLRRSRARYPNQLAFVYEAERLTYADFDARVNQTAHAFLEDGVKQGSTVAVFSRNSLDFAVVNFALARTGAIMVPVNFMLSVSEVAYILQHAEVDTLLAPAESAATLDAAAAEAGVDIHHRYLMEADIAPSALAHWTPLRSRRSSCSTDEVAHEVDDRDVAHILYTSGTESRPKGVMLTHANLVAEYVSMMLAGRHEPSDIAIHALPLYHSAQLHAFLGPLVYMGATGIILPQATPQIILETIERERATLLFAPPTVWIAMLRHPDFDQRDLSSLRKCIYGAAIMPVEVQKELHRRLPGARLWNMYGQTEVAPLATGLSPEDHDRKPGSVGLPTINVEARIVDDDDQPVPAGTLGEIVLRTPHAMLGYLKEPEKTAEAFRNGWFHTGDLGVMDEEGYITVIDRKKDMIKTGGVNVASSEVEEAIYQHPGVSEVAVIGVPDDYWMEAVTAVIVPKPGVELNAADLEAHCRERLGKFKIPKHFVFVESLPKNPSGKILKRALRDQFANLGKAGA
ncbi:long-chain-fatty-acid--CoA ligase [Alicyclobacillus cycloheptanicus]|uniref:Fatty-acyl-CoA synthase n=1 Tax=Alicyclobacillus cycloheptanicus TaxID=1457 RepID=A0ABT9XFA2_9BACL|nr:fatty acyl-CoA synthetase [Alicyclobacillus cycloheptanicus]MDQ0188978.1 fatty-acyl-CoA synthase [Alicyclobacillus cycloheptanicus]WDM01677.1 long-chain-fatty-acid--CoA ligase [Alicyclobacillus cycloheptanicus]